MDLGTAWTSRVDMTVNVRLGRNLTNLFQGNKLPIYKKTILFPPKDFYSFSSPVAKLRIKLCLSVLFFRGTCALRAAVCRRMC